MTLLPRRAHSASAALPIAPRPTTATSYLILHLRFAGVTRHSELQNRKLSSTRRRFEFAGRRVRDFALVARRSEENARSVGAELFRSANSQRATTAMPSALLNP